MPILVRCGHCNAQLKFRDDALGKRAKCPKCKAVVQVVTGGERQQRDGDEGETFLAHLADAAAASSQSQLYPVVRDPHAESAATAGPAVDEDFVVSETRLGARPRLRMAALAVLLIPVVFAPRLSLPERLMSCFVPLLLTGTFRTCTIRGDRVTTRLHLAFFPVMTRGCNLRGISSINVKYGGEGSGMGTLLLFGPLQWILGWLFDVLMPSVGGPFQIHLVTAKGRELVAWQGFIESRFQSTLALFVRLTNAEVRSM